MQPVTQMILGVVVLLVSAMILAYRLLLTKQVTTEIKKKSHHKGTVQGGDGYSFTVELPDGTEGSVDVWEFVYNKHESGDQIAISYVQGPEWWGTSVYYGRGLFVALIPAAVALAGTAMLIWGLLRAN